MSQSMKNDLSAIGALKVAIQTEINSYKMYSRSLRFVNNNRSREIIRLLMEEKLNHKKRLEELYTRLSGKRILALNLRFKKLHRQITQHDISPLHLLKLVIWNEKDSVRFYEEAAENSTNPEGRQIFKRLVLDEKNHLKMLEQEYNTLQKDENEWDDFCNSINQSLRVQAE